MFEAELCFSYWQVFVYDESIPWVPLALTAAHLKQGFARAPSELVVATLLQFGIAKVRATIGPYVAHAGHSRVIAVPFYTPSGKVLVEGPEEVHTGRQIRVPPGHYMVAIAQQALREAAEPDCDTDCGEVIELFFSQLDGPAEHSQVVKADPLLDPPDPLIEATPYADR